MAESDEDLQRDAKILKSMGVNDYEPRVVHQFLELWYRYVVDVLSDAHVYSEHDAKATIDCDDVKLAIQSKFNFSFSQPPPRESWLARNRTKIPLPKSIVGSGIPHQPEQEILINPNYQFMIPNKQIRQAVGEIKEEEGGGGVDPNPSSPSQEQKTGLPQNQNTTPQVSFPLGANPPR